MIHTTRSIMGMPITIHIDDRDASQEDVDAAFAHFVHVDEVFSTYKPTSEISRFNNCELTLEQLSSEVREVMELCEQTKHDTHGYFDAQVTGIYDPSGLVKGLAIQQVAELLWKRGRINFYVDAGGDIQFSGVKADGNPWSVGIRSPFQSDILGKISITGRAGVATSGTYLRGHHIQDPYHPNKPPDELVSLTVVAPTIYEADRLSTPAFAMGRAGMRFLETHKCVEAYAIDHMGIAFATKGFIFSPVET